MKLLLTSCSLIVSLALVTYVQGMQTTPQATVTTQGIPSKAAIPASTSMTPPIKSTAAGIRARRARTLRKPGSYSKRRRVGKQTLKTVEIAPSEIKTLTAQKLPKTGTKPTKKPSRPPTRQAAVQPPATPEPAPAVQSTTSVPATMSINK